jgi:hypothetical protein
MVIRADKVDWIMVGLTNPGGVDAGHKSMNLQ